MFLIRYVDGFKGPKFGIEGVRKLLGVKKRPLLNNMIKPCTGYGLELGAELFQLAAMGGCDIVKDDELIADASFNSMKGCIFGKLPRLADADIVVIPAPYGKAPIIVEEFDAVARNLRYPLYHLKPAWSMAFGGITPPMVSMVVQELGNDIVIGSRGGIHAHPDGPVAGGKAFRQAIDATVERRSLEEYAKEHRELAISIGAWGDKFKFRS